MSFTHTNRRGQVYHLQSKPRKNGTIGYSFTKKPTGTPADRLPDGYEVWEDPDDAQVHCRRIKPTQITPAEKEMVITEVQKHAGTSHVIVDVVDDSLVVYAADVDEGIDKLAHRVFGASFGLEKLKQMQLLAARYSKMMKFELEKGSERTFSASRWCFRGSIDDWHYLDGGQPLATLVKKYVRHLGRGSFFELT